MTEPTIARILPSYALAECGFAVVATILLKLMGGLLILPVVTRRVRLVAISLAPS